MLSQLLQHPAALADFQERVVTDGGAYWDDVTDRSDDLTASFERGKKSLARVFEIGATAPNDGVVTKAVPSELAKWPRGTGYRIWALASTGIAACLAVAVGWLAAREPAGPPVPKAQVAWGWGKPGGLAADQSNPKDYLRGLAASAEEWSQYQPTDPVGVGTRIAELRVGCTRLMHSAYGPLAPADKAWLLDHCRAWAKVLDGHQQALDAGTDPLTVRAGMDESVRAIAATLREKAKQVG